tara:strand:+ start:50 stop:1450 length:1401 start_codon:yes stop_codon:yes gene_type:complete
MADITVQVSSAGLTAYGSQSWGSFSYGGNNQPSVTVQAGTQAYPEQGWGGKQWGANLWGDLINNEVIATGNSLTFSIGTESVEGQINTGWGRVTYGSAVWNGYGNVIPSNVSLATSVQSVTINGEINSGWGGEAWGENAWGIFGDVLASGNQLSITTESNQDAWGADTWSAYNTRWGGVGSVNIGIFNEIPITQAQELNTTVNSVEISIATEIFLSENPLNTLSISEGTVDPAPDVMPSGVSLATSLGTIQAYNEQGWGRDDWGTEVWGAEGEWVYVDVTGQSLSADSGIRETWGQDEWGATTTEWGGVSITEVDISVNVLLNTEFTPGWGSEIAWGQQSWGQATVDMSMTSDEGTVDPAPDTDITGVQINTTVNSILITADSNLTLTGQELSTTLGDEEAIPNTQVDITGIEMSISVENATAGLSVEVLPTGVTTTTSSGTIGLNAWELVDSGTAPTWTVVDKAA